MVISRGSDYAVRAMIHLAGLPVGEQATTEEIAEQRGVSMAFLSKILARMAHAGLVRTSRGAAGGVYLARPAEEISLLEILEAVQGPLILNICTDPYDRCPWQEGCGAHPVFLQAQRALERIFRDAKLSDIAAREKQSRLAPETVPN